MNWQKTATGYRLEDAATSSVFEIERKRNGTAIVFVLLVDGEPYGPVGSLAGRREVAGMLLASRRERVGHRA